MSTVVLGVLVAALPLVSCARPEVKVCDDKPALIEARSRDCVAFGVTTPGGPTAVAEFERVTRVVGRAPQVVLSFSDFAAPPPLEGLEAVARIGAEPIVTWEPWQWLANNTYDTSKFSMQAIADGVHDDYLYWWADSLAGWGRPVYLRFAHEPNGTWYPWSVTGGTSPQTYIRAWRHIYQIFEEKRATNVRWVWAPNVSFPGSTPIGELYPGDAYVDLIGIDGYNWGTSQPWSHWIAPVDLFGPTVSELSRIAPSKPMAITEVGCANSGGSKPDWVRELLTFIGDEPQIRAFVWFDHDKEADWRLASTPESAAAFAELLGRQTTE